MIGGDTDIGGGDRSFRTTIWSDIVAAGDPNHPKTREHLNRLIGTYWKPVYAYLRSAWRASAEDAKDYTQAFFTRLVEKSTWSRIQQDRGSFRSYLKAALKYFMINYKRDENTRRPDARALSLEVPDDAIHGIDAVSPDETPEHAYDREWFKVLLGGAIESLRVALNAEGKPRYFDVFKAYCLDVNPLGPGPSKEILRDEASGGPSYKDIATKLGMHHSDVRNYLSHCRRMIRQILKDRIREYVATDADAENELMEAFGA